VSIVKLALEFLRIGFEVIAQRSQRLPVFVDIHQTGTVGGKIDGLYLKLGPPEHFVQRVKYRQPQAFQVLAWIAVLVDRLCKPGRPFKHDLILLVKKEQLLIGLAYIKYRYDRYFHYNPVATVFVPRSLISWLRTSNSRNNCTGLIAAPALLRASATSGRTSVRKACCNISCARTTSFTDWASVNAGRSINSACA